MEKTMNDALRAPSSEYLSVAETAKLVRAALAKAFPGQKFSVRSESYSGGASIDVKYTGGPMKSEVEAVVDPYRGGDFDGMVDMKYSRYSWLAKDGSASRAWSPGTAGQKGSDPETWGDPHAAGCRYVRFGADFIFVERKATDADYWAAVVRFERLTGLAVRHESYDHSDYVKTGEKTARGFYKYAFVPRGKRVVKLYCFETKSEEPWNDDWYGDPEKVEDYANGGVPFGMMMNRHDANVQERPLVVAMSDVERDERARYGY